MVVDELWGARHGKISTTHIFSKCQLSRGDVQMMYTKFQEKSAPDDYHAGECRAETRA